MVEHRALFAARDDQSSALIPTLPPEPAHLLEERPPPTRIGKYCIVEEIGRGGVGLVYQALRDDGLFDQQVAIKLIRTTILSDITHDQFATERRAREALRVRPGVDRPRQGGTRRRGCDPAGAERPTLRRGGGMTFSPDVVEEGYRVVFDNRTRSAHLAALMDARCNEPTGWPTVDIVRKVARLFEVSAAELGAFFGLLRLEENYREVWVDVVRSPHTAWLAPVESLSRQQAVALGYMRMLAD